MRVTPFLWLADGAEDAAAFYLSVFDDAEVVDTAHRPPSSPGEPPEVMTVSMRLAGQELSLLNGGPHYELTPAFSLMISCDSQEQADRLWSELGAGGVESRCGWVTDRFGVTWQVVPPGLQELLADPDPGRAGRAMASMLQMTRLDVAEMRRASLAAD